MCRMKYSDKWVAILWFCAVLCTSRIEAFAPPRLLNDNTLQISFRPRIDFRQPRYVANRNENFTLRPSFLYGINAQEAIASVFRSSGPVPVLQAFVINAVLFNIARSKLLSALTPSGYVHAMILGTMLWTTLGWRGWLYCVMYLILGQVVTKVGFADKEKRGIAESRGGRRGPENVWGSAATSLICAILHTRENAIWNMNPNLFLVGYVAALATKLADTFASEIGKAYGKTTFLITTLERVKPGTEGAISAEGTAAAVLGGFLLSMSGYILGLITLPAVGVSTIAAFVATNAESLIGATIQGKKGFRFMTNEVVNFVNTLIGGAIAITAGRFILQMV
jgi:uncharacterized protein (TIGR00297 family)